MFGLVFSIFWDKPKLICGAEMQDFCSVRPFQDHIKYVVVQYRNSDGWERKRSLFVPAGEPHGDGWAERAQWVPRAGLEPPIEEPSFTPATILKSSPKGKETAWGNTTWFRHWNTLGVCGMNSTATHLEWETGRFVVPESSCILVTWISVPTSG